MAASESLEEPNLTPLLDLVLQLVMFFMLVVHFDNEQKNERVQLPKASLAVGLTKENKVVFVNLLPEEASEDAQNPRPTGRSTITVFDKGEMREYTDQNQLKNFLENQFKMDQALAKPGEWEAGKGRSLVILRADKSCYFKQVYDVMKTARAVGYTEIQLRAQVDQTVAR